MSRKPPQISINSVSAFANPVFQNEQWYREVGYEDAKNLIRENFQKAALSFIEIGYYLKHIKDNRLYEEGEYKNIWDFAWEEFGLKQSVASRYMKMCSTYSANGDSPYLDDKYQNFSKSQLQEMLSLPDKIKEKITPDMTVKEIRKNKNGSQQEEEEIVEQYISGQMNIIDFPEVLPEYGRPEPEVKHCWYNSVYLCHIDRIVGCAGCCSACLNSHECEHICARAKHEKENKKPVATSQQQEQDKTITCPPAEQVEELSALGLPVSVYPEDSLIDVEYAEVPAEPVQPELPIMKNMDQREEFVLSYHTWPMWCKSDLTEETFYRYNLPDGTAIVVKEYPYTYWGGESEGKVLYLLKPKHKHFKDSETNMTCIKEHLKEVGKQ